MAPLLNKIIKLSTVQVLGIVKTPDEDIFYVLQIKKKGNNIDFSPPVNGGSVDDILKSVDLNRPTILVIDGKGILTKKIDSQNETDTTWKKNLDFKTIYFTEIKVNSHYFMSFCRKKTVDDHLEILQKKGLEIIDFYLGPLTAAFLYPAIKEAKIYANDAVLEFNEDSIYNIDKSVAGTREYEFNGKKLSKYHLPLYGAAVDFFLKFPDVSRTKPEGITDENLLYKKGFEYFGKGMLAFFLVALLASYLLVQHLSVENVKLNQENIFSNQTFKHIKELQDIKAQKLAILNETGHLSKHFLNFYSYELVKSIPASIELKRLYIFPVQQEIKENKKVSLESDVIICSGITVSEIAFNGWLNELKGMKWIKRFEILTFKKDKKNIQQFEIKIFISHV